MRHIFRNLAVLAQPHSLEHSVRLANCLLTRTYFLECCGQPVACRLRLPVTDHLIGLAAPGTLARQTIDKCLGVALSGGLLGAPDDQFMAGNFPTVASAHKVGQIGRP